MSPTFCGHSMSVRILSQIFSSFLRDLCGKKEKVKHEAHEAHEGNREEGTFLYCIQDDD